MKKILLSDIIAALFVFLFVYAASSKLMDYQKFRVQLGQSPLLTAYAPWVAWMVPALEIGISLMLISNRYRRAGLYASFSLMTMFSAYIIAITRFSDYVPCSCGGILSKMGWNQHLVFNLVFVLLAAVAILNGQSNKNSKKLFPTEKLVAT